MRHPFNQAFRRRTSLDEMVEEAALAPGIAPTAFIFHASRCGSTLMAQMLAALPTHIVVSEPPMVDTILRTPYYLPGVTREEQQMWLRALVSILGRAHAGESRLVIKLDAWSIFELPLLRAAFPQTPWFFLYRDPVEIAVSQLAQRASYMVPGFIGPSPFQINVEEALQMGDEGWVARVLGRIFLTAVEMLEAFGGTPLHYQTLPPALWTTLRDRFGVADTAEATSAMQAAARWDAKNPHFEFVSDATRKQQAASPRLRELIDEWATPHYAALEAIRSRNEANPAPPTGDTTWNSGQHN